MSFSVPTEYNKTERLDKYIASLSSGINRSQLKASAVEIRINGKVQKLSYKVKAGDTIDISCKEAVPTNIEPEDIPLSVIYEDDDVCVVDKAQGMVTHPAAGNWTGTLVNALLFRWKKEKIKTEGVEVTQLRPGIVHRLDKDTSGLIITAKNLNAEQYLQAQFCSHKNITKEYIAICTGRPPHKKGVICTYIARDKKNRQRFAVSPTEGKYSVTFYKCIACYGEYSLLRLRIKTGRTHQIRVHLRHLHCPILGDSLYGHKDRLFANATLMLHARLLCIRLPKDGQSHRFVSATPERFLKVLCVLHSRFAKVLISEEK